MLDHLRTAATSRFMPLWAAVVAMVLGLPSLWIGWLGDDWFHLAMLRGVEPLAGRDPAWELFSFIDSASADHYTRALGVVPWFATEQLAVGFLRPISALTHMLDTLLWTDSAVLQHAHSLLWTGAAVFAVAVVLKQVLREHPLVAGVAAFLYAVDDAHALPTAWLANRNAMIAVAFSASALALHIAWRQRDDIRLLLGSLMVLTLALLSGEASIAVVAYIAAWELCVQPGGLRKAMSGVLPSLVLIVGWRLVYSHLGYGATDSGLYLDPGSDPLRFTAAALTRAPTLLLAQWTNAPIDLLAGLPSNTVLATALSGAVITAVMVVLLRPVLRAHREARFFGLALLGAIIPPCATFPMDRLLTLSGIASAALLAWLAVSETEGWRGRAGRGLLLWHGPLAALLLAGRVGATPLAGFIFDEGNATVTTDEILAEQTLVFLTGTDFAAAYTPIIRSVTGEAPVPDRCHILGHQFTATELLRQDDSTLVLAPDDGFLAIQLTQLLRDPDEPFTVGHTVSRQDFTAEVRAVTDDGRPSVVAFRFAESLDHPSYRFVVASETGYVDWTPPAVGGRERLPAVLPASSLFTSE